ncbi:MAG: DUF4190 domain-containing protein [Clostridia bacterium]|nr:DUF4190 domain-containing protein [Clostridia bacterium]
MAIASLILGIFSFFIAIIPAVGAIALIPAIISFVFGIVALSKKVIQNNSKGIQIAGVIVSSISMAIAIVWLGVIVFCIGEFDYLEKHSSYVIEDEYERDNFIPKYQLGEDANLEDLVVKIEKNNLDSNNENVVKAKEGYRYVSFKVHIKNISYHDAYLYGLSIRLIDNKGNPYETDYNRIYSNTTLIQHEIEPGKVTTGTIAFEIPNNVLEDTILFTLDETYQFKIK